MANEENESTDAASLQPVVGDFALRSAISCKFCSKPAVPTEPLCHSCQKRQPLEWRITPKEFQYLYLMQGYKCEQIAEQYKVSAIYIQRLKNHYGIDTKSKKWHGATENFGKRLNGKLTKEDFERLYYVEKKNHEEIGNIYGVSRQTVIKYAKIYGVVSRTPSNLRGLVIDESFFSKWSAEMAWVLGLIITDGSIGEGASGDQLCFSVTDRELVENILKAMRSNHPIREIKPHGFSKKIQYRFATGNQKIVLSLNALGVARKKSLVVKYPPVPSEHLRHFLRGVFEGDGSIHITNRTASGEPIYRITIVSGSKDFIEGLQHAITQHFGITGQLHRTILKSKKEFFQLIWCAVDDVRKLGELMYQNVDESLLLSRKRDIFKEFESTQYQRFLRVREADASKADAASDMIRQIFKAKNVNVGELARMMDVSQAEISRLKLGTIKPTKEQIKIIGTFLD